MATYAFSGGIAEIKGAGQRSKLRFNGTWVNGDSWTVGVTSQLSGDFTLGKGNIAGKTLTCVFKLRSRVLLGFTGGFAISAIDDPTGWEEQNVGAAVFPFTTQYGLEDSVYAFSVLGDQLAVFGAKTIQLWTMDADPTKWTLLSILDNTGTSFGLGVQSIGELDVFYPDRTGIRSLKTKELTSNAYSSDVGTPVDSLIRAKLVLATANNYPICSVIEPTTKQYWVFIYDTIFVYSFSQVSKVSAWSTFKPTFCAAVSLLQGVSSITGLTAGVSYHWQPGNAGSTLVNGSESVTKACTIIAAGTSVTINGGTLTSTLFLNAQSFRPVRFYAVEGSVYVLSSTNLMLSYNPVGFDFTNVTVETPWLTKGSISKAIQLMGVDLAAVGSWRVKIASNPVTNNFVYALQLDPVNSPTYNNSSTFDLRRFAVSGNGTHFKARFECDDSGGAANNVQPKLASMTLSYNESNQK